MNERSDEYGGPNAKTMPSGPTQGDRSATVTNTFVNRHRCPPSADRHATIVCFTTAKTKHKACQKYPLIRVLSEAQQVGLSCPPALAKECYAPDARAQERAFSRAVITEGGKTVWLGGQTGSPEKNFEGQARDIFAELDKTIKAVGGAGLRDMVTMTVFISDVRLGDRLTEIRKEIFKECFPGSALITVTGFARPGILIEIQGMAVIGGK
jgi:2-iminobutanoate/2-iminopropanoate deaminase